MPIATKPLRLSISTSSPPTSVNRARPSAKVILITVRRSTRSTSICSPPILENLCRPRAQRPQGGPCWRCRRRRTLSSALLPFATPTIDLLRFSIPSRRRFSHSVTGKTITSAALSATVREDKGRRNLKAASPVTAIMPPRRCAVASSVWPRPSPDWESKCFIYAWDGAVYGVQCHRFDATCLNRGACSRRSRDKLSATSTATAWWTAASPFTLV